MTLIALVLAVLAHASCLTNRLKINQLEAEKALKDPNDVHIEELQAKILTLSNILAALENKISHLEKGNIVINVPVKHRGRPPKVKESPAV